MKIEDKDTRYYIDLDLVGMKIIGWEFDQRQKLIKEKMPDGQVRIYITKGQYNKLLSEK